MNDDSTVLAATIAAVASVIVGFMSLFAAKRDTRTPSKKQLYEMQLNNVWEPLDKLLTYSRVPDPDRAFQTVKSIVSEHYKLIPKGLIAEVTKISRKDEITEFDLEEIKKISSSYFHWIKRNLGYPYDRKKIKINYSPRSRIDVVLSAIGYGILYALLLIAALIILISLLMLFENDQFSLPNWPLSGITIACAVSSLFLFLSQNRE